MSDSGLRRLAIKRLKGFLMIRHISSLGRIARRRRSQHHRRLGLNLESLECRRLLAGDGIEPEPMPPFSSSISGTKWEDLNANGQREDNEPGLAGVTIYIDANDNRRLDRDEIRTVSQRDRPNTEEDESGRYVLRGLDAGTVIVREIVPRGFRQTFPDSPVLDGTIGGSHTIELSGGDNVTGIDFGNHRVEVEPGSVHGLKWQDTNGNGERDHDEPGLGGVIVFSDLNRNGRYDRNEPMTRTSHDIPETDFDEEGLYELSGLRPGVHLIREVVPDGFVQTFPPIPTFPVDTEEDPFVTTDPSRLDLLLQAGEETVVGVSMTVHPFCIVPINVDVVSSDPDIAVSNLSGVHVNGCGGDVSKFEVSITGDGGSHQFDLLFVDPEAGNEHTSIPVTINSPFFRGAHRVLVESGGGVDGIDFGNRPVATSVIQGLKWLDANGNGQRDEGEPGLEGVTIYIDRNLNGQLDRGEPATRTQRDNPNTAADETGLYRFGGLRAGEYVVREIVPDGYMQTSPGVGGQVIRTQTGSYNPGIALDLNLGDVAASVNDDGSIDATVDVEVTWPDSCGMIKEGETIHSQVGPQLLIEVSGHQVGDQCAEVITVQTVSVPFDSIAAGKYDVVVTLHEDLTGAEDVATLNLVGRIAVGGPGQHVVKVGVNEVVDGIDFGNQSKDESVSVHGIKWLDRNGNGVRDRGERGVAGVTIYSDLNLNGQFDEGEPHTVTMADDRNTRIDEAGHYWLEGLKPGEHLITEILPDGFERTFPPPTDIAAPWPLNEPYYFPNLLPGQILTGIDFGNHPVKVEGGSLHGQKWVDVNGNGMHEPDEPGLAGVTIYLDVNLNNEFDRGEPAVRTMRDNPNTDRDETGFYSFNDVEPGFYIVREVVPDGFRQTFPSIMLCEAVFCAGRGHIVNVDSGQSIDGLDFGNQPVREPGVVHGIKWADRNGNRERDRDEPGLPGVVIYSDTNLNGRLDRGEPRTTTMKDDPDTKENEAGRYWLRLLPGEHLILEEVPEGFEQTFPDPRRRVAHPFNLGHRVDVKPGAPIDGVDFGNQPIVVPATAAVEGVKWLDRNGNGERDRGERGLPGVVIYADLNGNGERDNHEPATRTRRDNPRTDVNEAGSYHLEVPPGRRVIREVLPRGFRQTFPVGPTVIGETHSRNLPPGRAIAYDLVDASMDPSAAGELGLELTFEVTWPDGCHSLLDRGGAKLDGETIVVEMYGVQVSQVCTLAIETQRQTFRVDAPPPGVYELNAVLFEAPLADVLPAQGGFEESFLLNGKLAVSSRAGHVVQLKPGQTASGRDFGNRPIVNFHAADFNLDGEVDEQDIDLLAIAVRGVDQSSDFDLSGDGDVDREDVEQMVRRVMELTYGDSNMDGHFNSADIVTVFQAGKYNDGIDDNATWAEGDWNGDGDFDSSDLVFVFQHGEYNLPAGAVDRAFE